ncbi:MAG: GPW/gp25 family protein [Anaerolineae bacterium]
MPVTTTSITGRGWAFPPRLNDRDRIATVQDDTEIQQAIYIIIFTAPGERVMRPDFGCEIHDLIFEPANDLTAATAERYVTEALNRWEPRINLTSVKVTPGGTEYGELLIEVEYTLKDQIDKRSLVYPFYLLPS